MNEDERGKTLYNSALLLADGAVKSIHDKTLLPTYDIFDEYRHFESNRHFHVAEYHGVRIAITICEDLWDELPAANEFGRSRLYRLSPMEELAKQNPSVVVNISASPFSYNQESWRKDVLISKARQYRLPLLYVNQTGAQAELIFDGGSVFIGPDGQIIKELKYFEEDFCLIDTDAPGAPSLQPSREPIEKMHQALLLGIDDYFRKTGFRKAVLGLSGGIDSALTAVLAVQALGAENVHGLLLPSKYSSEHSVADARQLAENLGIGHNLIPIGEAVKAFEDGLMPVFKGLKPDVTEENIQARARGIYLMAWSNKFGSMLLNTSNKSECAVGYGTLYGDMNGGLAVLGDLYKTDVFRMSHMINRTREIIPENTLTKPPSAELRPGQKDSDSLPDYDILDQILFSYIEMNLPPEEIIARGADAETVKRVIRMVNLNEYKRFQAAPILRISSKAFGFGRRIPLVARF